MENIKKTLAYYDKNSEKLYDKYESANLENIQKYILKFIKKNDFILELGFGSGREINFLLKNGFKYVYGIDGCKAFVEKAKKRFKSDKFYLSVLPEINIVNHIKFDFVFAIALWMHLPTETYEKIIKNIVKLLKKNGKVLLSFSLEERKGEERYFQKVDEKLLDLLFEKYGLKKINEMLTNDSLNRNITWKTVVYEKY